MKKKIYTPKSNSKQTILKLIYLFYTFRGDLGAEMADYRYLVEFPNYLASKNDIIVVFLDGRGSGNGGDKLLHSVGKQPGHPIVNDIVTVVQ